MRPSRSLVGRDARDVALSLWNHYQGQKEETFGPADSPSVLATVTLDAMRVRADRLDPGIMGIFKEGAKTFYFKGTNGRWRDVFSVKELALYEQKAAQVLTPACRAWLEQGRRAI